MKKSSSNWTFLGLNLLLAALIVITVLVVVVISLEKYTAHGYEIEVPQVTGLYPNEAECLLSNSKLRLEVIDSTFSQRVPLGTIVEQTPPAESHVKENRAIYVVINASAKRQVILPELHDVSYRQAENILRQLGLRIDSIVFEPSEYRDLVLDLRVGDRSLETSEKVAEGTMVTMVVGQGRGTEMVRVPDLVGLKLVEARSLLLSQHLSMGKVEFDVEPEDMNREEYVVYTQHPNGGSVMQEGSAVQIKLSLDKEKAIISNVVEDEEEFF